MTPNKRKTVNGHLIEQYYWAGDQVVYIDGHAYTGTFDDAVKRCEHEHD